jgi:hypothetical protein
MWEKENPRCIRALLQQLFKWSKMILLILNSKLMLHFITPEITFKSYCWNFRLSLRDLQHFCNESIACAVLRYFECLRVGISNISVRPERWIQGVSTIATQLRADLDDHFRLSGDLRREPEKAVFASVARRSQWFRFFWISPTMWRSRKHSDCDFGHETETFSVA